MKHLYMIASTPRSGSNFLSKMLWETRFLGRPAEYFNFNKPVLVLSARFGTDTMDAYWEALLEKRTTANGVFGFKVYYEHLQFLHLTGFDRQLGNLKIVRLVRNDPIAEAVSFPRAIQTQAWTSSSAQNGREPIYNVDHLNWCLAKLIEQKNGWSRFFQQQRFIPDCVIRRVVRCSLASNERERRLSRLSPDTGPNDCSSRHAQTVRRGECRMD